MIVRCMAGHSKWAKIKRSKADNDLVKEETPSLA